MLPGIFMRGFSCQIMPGGKLAGRGGCGRTSTKAAPPRPANLPPGMIWHEKPHMDIPGSIWLPDTGYGALASSTERYLHDGLTRITQGDQSRWLVVYCQKDCWMSWNAAKRALTMGYKNIAWYPDGTDGWQASGLPVQQAEPAPGDAE